MKKVIVWGSGAEYDGYYKYFEVERLKQNMEIVAVVLNEEGIIGRIDGIEVIKIEEITEKEYDYLISMNREEPETVNRILELLKVPSEKVIQARVFQHPFFDFNRYLSVKESKVSIISNNCWGGYTYNALGLQFLSPFINMVVGPEDYIRLLNRFDYYMQIPLTYIKEEYDSILQQNYPVAGLDDVTLHFLHYPDFISANEAWEKRKRKLNLDNIFVEMAIVREEDIEKFMSLPFQNKIGFTAIACDEKDIISFPILENGYLDGKYNGNMLNFVNHMAMQYTDECRQYDILKLLNHEKDFLRVSY